MNTRMHLAALLFAALPFACAGEAPRDFTLAKTSLRAAAAPAAAMTARAAAPAPSSEPTVLSEADKRRDEARVPLATAVVDAYPNWNGFFSSLVADYSPDGKRFLFGSLRDGSPQIYEGEVANPRGAPRAVTAGAERSIWARYTLDGKFIVYKRDTKGDENHHLWRVNTDGTGAIDLTPGETMHHHEAVFPRKRPDMMFYGATRTSSPATAIYAHHVASGERKSLYTNPHTGWVNDATSDGARVLFQDVPTLGDGILVELDAATGKTRRIYPPEGKHATVFGASYSVDDARIYLGTDEGMEASVLLMLDARTGKELARYVNDAPRVASVAPLVSPKGDRVAIEVQAGNHGEARILDAKTLKLQRAVKVPLGDVYLGSYRGDGKELSLLVSQADKPADVYAADAATGVIRPLRDDERPGLESLPPITTKIEEVKAFDGLTIPINRYLPGAGAPAKLPTIAVFHGGPASSYAVRWNAYARYFVSLGYAVIEPNVRGSTGFGRAYAEADDREKRADWLRDLETVNAWAKSQPWCDPDRVVVWGQSYGGYTTLMALTRQPALWRAGVDLYGFADLKHFLPLTDAGIRSLYVSEFGDLDADGPLLERFSPMNGVDAVVAPLFVYAGQNDPRVPRPESDAVVRALRARRVPVEYMVAANEGHTVDRRETKVELLTRTARFIEDATKGPRISAR